MFLSFVLVGLSQLLGQFLDQIICVFELNRHLLCFTLHFLDGLLQRLNLLMDCVKFDHGFKPKQKVVSRLGDFLHSVEFKSFVIEPVHHSLDLPVCDFSDSLTEVFQCVDERRRIRYHSSDLIPTSFFILNTSWLQIQNGDTQLGDLVGRF